MLSEYTGAAAGEVLSYQQCAVQFADLKCGIKR